MFDPKQILDALVAGNAQAAQSTQTPPSGGGTGDLLGNVLAELKKVAGEASQKTEEAGGIGNVAKQIFGQATSGVKEAAGKVDAATGAGDMLGNLVKQVSGGKSAGELVEQVKALAANNPAAAGAIAAGLGALVLGTKGGRGLAFDAAKLGGLVLIGGLAYKAYQNHSQGKPMLDIGATPAPAPRGSGFEASAQSSNAALLYVRAMIAAAASDGQIDAGERARIFAGLKQAGMDEEAVAFLESEMTRPATVAELAAGATSPEVALQIFAAARIAIEPDSAAEQAFLSSLASALRIDPALAAEVEAGARGMRA